MVSLAWSTQVVAQHLISVENGEDTWLEDIRVRDLVTLADLLREKGLDDKGVGVVGIGASGTGYKGRGWVSYDTWVSVKEALPAITFLNVTNDYTVLMLERSPRDIECLRRAAAAGEEACRALMEVARIGATELDLYSAGMCALHKSGVYSKHMLMTSGPHNFSWGPPMWLHRPQSPRVLEEGDIVMVEMFPHYGGIEAQLQLAVAIGKVRPEHETCAKAARKAYEAGVAAVKPGATFGQVCDAMEQPVREISGWHLTPMIHTLNPLGYTSGRAQNIEKQVPEIGQKYINVRGRNFGGGDLELKPGMSFELEPNAHLGRYRINIGGTVIVTSTGSEELNKIPTSLQRV
jgi:Xaa-Pro aminopeptidase